jgi:hypothetical protein
VVLSILISTLNGGIDRISQLLLSPRKDVEYIIVHQYTEERYKSVPVSLRRSDTRIYQMMGMGLSRSRNLAIKCSRGDIALIADDDVKYEHAFFDKVFSVFRQFMLDIALFKIMTDKGEKEYKVYPIDSYELSLGKYHSPSSIEIAFRLESVRDKIEFDERFGLGSYICGGEEWLFIRDALQSNLKVIFFPEYVVIHPLMSSSKYLDKFNCERAKIVGATYARMYGMKGIIRFLFYMIRFGPRVWRAGRSLFVYYYCAFRGFWYIFNSNYDSDTTIAD